MLVKQSFTLPHTSGWGIFSLQFVSVCLSDSNQNSSQKDALIYAVFAKRLLTALAPTQLKWVTFYLVEGQGNRDTISIFSLYFSVNFPTVNLTSFVSDQN